MSELDTLLAGDSKVLWGLVADVVKAVKAGEGEKRTGRRPAATCGSIDELYDVLFPPAYATEPIPVALPRLLQERGLSRRALAVYTGIPLTNLARLADGQQPTLEQVEAIAKHLNVRPTYFSEYRALKLGQVVTNTFLANPTLSAEVVRSVFLTGVPA